mgnify:CR=1 FL=1|jgi:RNA polymerase-binding protein DksA
MEKAKKAQLEKYKRLLESKRDRVIGDVERLKLQTLRHSQRDAAGDLSSYSIHMADVGSDAAERETMLDLASTQQKLLEKINKSLERIEQGVYGTCELCGGAIDAARLEALPEATVCIKCMNKYNL